MRVIRWEDPPVRVGRWQLLAAELRDNPGRWALVGQGLTRQERDSARVCLNKWGCSVKWKKVDQGGYSIWARSQT